MVLDIETRTRHWKPSQTMKKDFQRSRTTQAGVGAWKGVVIGDVEVGMEAKIDMN